MYSDHCAPARNPRRQRGQAMPLVLVFLIVLCVGMLVTFNTGQVVGKKVELTNAADAAAYSIAVEEARARNLAAYLNRARVANEIAIAQMVSLNSWLTMVHSTSDNFGDFMKVVSVVFTVVPGLNVVLRAIERAMAAINRAMTQFRKAAVPALGTAVAGLDLQNGFYATAAELALNPIASGANIQKLATTVVKDNVPDAEVSTRGKVLLAQNAVRAGGQLEHFRPGNANGLTRKNRGMERYRNVVMASRDGFTRDRSSGGLGVFHSNGGTDMVEYDRWSGVDVFEIRVPIPLASDFKFALGWGGTQAVDRRRPRFFPGMEQGRGWRSPYENSRAYRPYNGVSSRGLSGRFIENDPAGPGFSKRHAYFGGYTSGISRDYTDVEGEGKDTKYSATPEGRDAGPVYTVEVATAARNARTSSALGIGAGRMELRDEAHGNQIRAMASAQVYFNRPYHLAQMRRSVFGRGDRKFEMGNMFSPYWQARLVDTPDADRIFLVAGG